MYTARAISKERHIRPHSHQIMSQKTAGCWTPMRLTPGWIPGKPASTRAKAARVRYFLWTPLGRRTPDRSFWHCPFNAFPFRGMTARPSGVSEHFAETLQFRHRTSASFSTQAASSCSWNRTVTEVLQSRISTHHRCPECEKRFRQFPPEQRSGNVFAGDALPLSRRPA